MSKKGNRSTSASAAFVVVNVGELKAAHASGGGTVRADVLHPGQHHPKHQAMGKGSPSRSPSPSRFWLMEDNGTYKMICYGGHLEMEHDGSVVWKGKATDDGFETTTTSLPARKCATLLDLALVGEKLKYGAHSGPSRATESEPVAKKSAAKKSTAKNAAPKNAAAKKTVPKKDAKWTVEVSAKGFEGRPLATYYFATKEDAEAFAANEQKLLVAQKNDHMQAVVKKKKTAPKKTAPKKTAPKRTAAKRTAAKRTTAARKTAPKKTAAAESKGVGAVETYTVSGQHGETVVRKDVRIQRPAGVSQKRIQGILDRLPSGKSRLSTVVKQLAKHGAAFVPWDDGKPGDSGAYETAVRAPAPASGPRPSKRGNGAEEGPPTSRSTDLVDDARFLDDLHAELKKAKAANLFETAKAIWLAGGRQKALEHMAATKGRSLVKAFLDWMDKHEQDAQAMLGARAS